MPGNGKRLVSKLKKIKNVFPQKFPKPTKLKELIRKFLNTKLVKVQITINEINNIDGTTDKRRHKDRSTNIY